MKTQLVGPVYHDQAYTHDFANPATWISQQGLGTSAWVLEPPPGFAYKLIASEVKASTNVKIHSPLQIWFQAKRRFGAFGPIPPVAGGGAAYLVVYNSMRDWIRRGASLPSVTTYPENPELTKPLLLINFEFQPAPILYSSIGIDDHGIPKWNRLVIMIADGQPYRDENGHPIELSLAKYMIEIYKEVPK